MRRGWGLVLAGWLALTVTAGCGIPGSTKVTVDGTGPMVEAGVGSGRAPETPRRVDAGNDPRQFVANFLTVAAGEPNQANDRVRAYILPSAQDQWHDKAEAATNVVRVVRTYVTARDTRSSQIRLVVQQVGLLRANGVLAPPASTETEYRFSVGWDDTSPQGQAGGLYVLDPPKVLLLDVNALTSYYQRRAVYFWTFDQSGLIPDQRWLPLAVPQGRRATEVVNWLLNGPSDWLAGAAARLPDRTEVIGTVPETEGRLEINLNTPSEDPAQLERLTTQLAWSLPEVNGQLDIKIRNRTYKLIDNPQTYRAEHPTYRSVRPPQRFCVLGGSVRALTERSNPTPEVPLTPEANRNVVRAGLSRSGENVLAALVTTKGRRQQLTVGAGPAPVSVRPVGNTYASISRPVWLRSADPEEPVGLVVADGVLYWFGTDGRPLTRLETGIAGSVAAVGASLDGYRMAFVVDRRLYVAALSVSGSTVTTNPARLLPTSLGSLTAVDWSDENALVVAGAGIYEVSVDGASEARLQTDDAEVTHLTAWPGPASELSSGRVMYETEGGAWAGLTSTFDLITEAQVHGMPNPQPAGHRSGPTAPFFLY